MTTRTKSLPQKEQTEKELPSEETVDIEIPVEGMEEVELPEIGVPENTVKIGAQLIEIRPMKLKYIRNRTAAFRHILEMYPLSDILAMENGFGDGRDGDKALYDWLVAVLDNEDIVRENYNDIDSETIYKILTIHRRIEKVDELETKLKNARTPREG